MAHATGELQLSKELVEHGYNSVEEIPGFVQRRHELAHIEEYISNYLDTPSLCLQIMETGIAAKVARDTETGDLIGAYGWKCIKHLGKGKDGFTFWGHKYGDKPNDLHIVKIISGYGENYHNHTEIFNAFMRKLFHAKQHRHPMLFDFAVKSTHTTYKCKKPFTQFNPKDMRELYFALRQVCSMNTWCIKNTGFVFWDLGYGNGRNFMVDSSDGNNLKWVDYGGAGMVRCPSFRELYKNQKSMPVLTLENSHQQPLKGKDNLVEGNSDFVMLQFILNFEFHTNPTSTADVWASMLQVRKDIVQEMKVMLPHYFRSRFANEVFQRFHDRDWLEANTWRELGKYIATNLQNK
jgi:hypothetical protein